MTQKKKYNSFKIYGITIKIMYTKISELLQSLRAAVLIWTDNYFNVPTASKVISILLPLSGPVNILLKITTREAMYDQLFRRIRFLRYPI